MTTISWFLLTDLARLQGLDLTRIHAKRMSIEEDFRDAKSPRNGFALRLTVIRGSWRPEWLAPSGVWPAHCARARGGWARESSWAWRSSCSPRSASLPATSCSCSTPWQAFLRLDTAAYNELLDEPGVLHRAQLPAAPGHQRQISPSVTRSRSRRITIRLIWLIGTGRNIAGSLLAQRGGVVRCDGIALVTLKQIGALEPQREHILPGHCRTAPGLDPRGGIKRSKFIFSLTTTVSPFSV